MLSNYRDTPHPATGLPPSAMMFRDPPNAAFPRVLVSDEQVKTAREEDCKLKEERGKQVNSSKYRKKTNVEIGDWVLIRNFDKESKFDPVFQPDPCQVTEVANGWIEVERNGRSYRRHLDDIKEIPNEPKEGTQTEEDMSQGNWNETSVCEEEKPQLRRSERLKKQQENH